MITRRNPLAIALIPVMAVFILTVFVPEAVHAESVRIMGTPVNMRQGPGTSYPVIFQAEAGQIYPLIKTEGLWCQIATVDGQHVWVFKKLVDILPGGVAPTADSRRPAGEEGASSTWKSRIRRIILPALLLAAAVVLLFKRRVLKRAADSKMQELSGYRRNSPFRYDGRPPEDDKWEM